MFAPIFILCGKSSPPALPPTPSPLAFIFVVICCQSRKIQLVPQCVHRQTEGKKLRCNVKCFAAIPHCLSVTLFVVCAVCVNSFLAAAAVICLMRVCRMRRLHTLMFTRFGCVHKHSFLQFIYYFGFRTIYRSAWNENNKKKKVKERTQNPFFSMAAPASHFYLKESSM